MYFILDTGTITRTYAFNDTGIHRRSVQPTAYDVVRALIGMSNPTGQLRRVLGGVAQERKHRHRVIARLYGHNGIIYGSTVNSWRGTGFQTAGRQTNFTQTRSQGNGRGVAGSPSTVTLHTHVHQAT